MKTKCKCRQLPLDGLICRRSRSLIAAGDKEKRLKRIHQRQENRPAAPLSTPRHFTRPLTTLQGLQEYHSLVENPPGSSPETPASTIQTNQSSDTSYAVPYQHMLGRFIAFMTMYQRRRAVPRSVRSSSMQRETNLSASSGGGISTGYLEPVSNGFAHALESQKSGSDCHYQELNEAPLLANRLTNI